MIERVSKVWLDGALVPWGDATVHALTHTLHYGFGAFEGIRAYAQAEGGTALFRLSDHVERLYRSTAAASIEIPFGREAIAKACGDVVVQNALRDAYVRPLVFIGDPNIIFAYWLNPVRVAVVAFPWTGFSDRNREDGTSAKISPYVRPKAHADLFKAKLCGHYALSVIAYGDAARSGFKQAIFLDEDGVVCESTGENLFMVSGAQLWTPPPSRSILIGITRLSVMEIASDLGYEVIERDFGVDDLLAADEIFTTGTASELLPIRSIESHPIGDGRLGPATRAIQARFTEAAHGQLAGYQRWLTPLASRVEQPEVSEPIMAP